MEGVGWEIRPAGWVVFFIVVAILAYYAIKWLRQPPDNNQEKNLA
jgi:hypothetical protein